MTPYALIADLSREELKRGYLDLKESGSPSK